MVYFVVFCVTSGQPFTLPPPFLPVNDVKHRSIVKQTDEPLTTLFFDSVEGSGELEMTSLEPSLPEVKVDSIVQQLEESEKENAGRKPGVYAFAEYKDFSGGFGFVRGEQKQEPTAWERLLGLFVDLAKVSDITHVFSIKYTFLLCFFLRFFRLPSIGLK